MTSITRTTHPEVRLSPKERPVSQTATDVTEPADNAQHNSRGRTWPWITAGLVGLAAATGIGGKATVDSARESNSDVWGSLSDPLFVPSGKASSADVATRSFTAQLIEVRARLARLQSVALPLLSEGEDLSHLLKSDGADPELLTRLNAFLSSSSKFSGASTANSGPYTDDFFEERLGNVETYARKLFELTTGKALPDSVMIKLDPTLPTTIGGRADELRGVVHYSGPNYPSRLSSILHEFGHLSAPIGEQSSSLGILGTQFRTDSVNMREEACAEVFRLAASQHIELPELRASVAGIDDGAIIDYLSGIDTPVRYNHACLVADVAINHYASAGMAFRVLCSNPDVPFEVQLQVEQVRELWSQGLSNEQAQMEISSLVRRVRAFRGEFLEALNRLESASSTPGR